MKREKRRGGGSAERRMGRCAAFSSISATKRNCKSGVPKEREECFFSISLMGGRKEGKKGRQSVKKKRKRKVDLHSCHTLFLSSRTEGNGGEKGREVKMLWKKGRGKGG